MSAVTPLDSTERSSPMKLHVKDEEGRLFVVELLGRAILNAQPEDAPVDATIMLRLVEINAADVDVLWVQRQPSRCARTTALLGEAIGRVGENQAAPGEIAVMRGAALLKHPDFARGIVVRNLIEVRFHRLRHVPDDEDVTFPELRDEDRGQLLTADDGAAAVGLLIGGTGYVGVAVPLYDFLQANDVVPVNPAEFDQRSEEQRYREELADHRDAFFDELLSGPSIDLGLPRELEIAE